MTLEQARAWQEALYDISWYDGLQKTDYTVSSDDGYVLHAQLIQNTIPTNRYVIISHGYTDNRFGTLKYAKMYLDLGFNVIIYDLLLEKVSATPKKRVKIELKESFKMHTTDDPMTFVIECHPMED